MLSETVRSPPVESLPPDFHRPWRRWSHGRWYGGAANSCRSISSPWAAWTGPSSFGEAARHDAPRYLRTPPTAITARAHFVHGNPFLAE